MRIFSILACVLLSFNVYSWNELGHELVAQIAYDNLTPKTKRLCNRYNHSLNKVFPVSNFVHSSNWLDKLHAAEVHWFDTLHYIDIPYSNDGTSLPAIADINALWGIEHAVAALNSTKTSDADKGMSLRILMHIVGDIHQPLHTIALVTHDLPQGDLGGNLFALGANPIGKNLHLYWDNGGGILVGQSTDLQVRNKARQLETQTPCSSVNTKSNPQQWINASHQLAISHVYTISPGTVPDKHYQLNAQNITQKQILVAGCRLASLLNKIHEPG